MFRRALQVGYQTSNFALENYHEPSFTLKILIIRYVFGARVVIAHPQQNSLLTH
jgi:hypothetical protein